MKVLKLIFIFLLNFGSIHGQSELKKDAILRDTIVLESGYSEINTFLDDRRLVSSIYHLEKLLFTRYFHDDLTTWTLLEFNELGSLFAISSFNGDCLEGMAYTFYNNNVLESIGCYKKFITENELKIETTSWNKSTGDLEFVTTIRDCESVKDGLWNYFDMRGLLVRSELWLNGACVECDD